MERRSTLLNQCFTQSCAHARLLCVKPQEAELAHNQQRAPLLRPPLTMKLKKKKKERKLASVHSQNFFNITSCIAAFLKHSWSLCNNFPTIAMVHSNATAFSFRPYTLCALPMTKRELLSKTHPAVCTYLFLLTYFHQKVQPWSNHDAAERPDWAAHMYVCCAQTGAVWVFTQVSYDLKRNVEISQIYCSCLTERLCKGKERNVSSSLRRHLRILEVAGRLFRALNCRVTETTRCVAHYRGKLSLR